MTENVKCKINERGKLIIVIDPTVKGELSGAGKSHILANARWLNLSDLQGEGTEGLKLNLMLIRVLKKPTKDKNGKPQAKQAKRKVVEPDDDDDPVVETKTKNRGKKPKLNKDRNGKVKAIASSKRPADKLKTKRAK